jgi:hypothetical protein
MKIANVITECTQCEHCVKAMTKEQTKVSILICGFPDGDNFLIDYNNDALSYQQTIPDKCPLEDYEQKPTTNE